MSETSRLNSTVIPVILKHTLSHEKSWKCAIFSATYFAYVCRLSFWAGDSEINILTNAYLLYEFKKTVTTAYLLPNYFLPSALLLLPNLWPVFSLFSCHLRCLDRDMNQASLAAKTIQYHDKLDTICNERETRKERLRGGVATWLACSQTHTDTKTKENGTVTLFHYVLNWKTGLQSQGNPTLLI